MKISLAQIKFKIGDFEFNKTKMIESINRAKTDKCDLICFSEMAACGFPAMDYLLDDHFINQSEQLIKDLCKYAHDIAIIVGAPTCEILDDDKKLYNSAYFLSEGVIKQIQHKMFLANCDIFDELRYFNTSEEWNIIHFKNKKIALGIGDIFQLNQANMSPRAAQISDSLQKQKPDLLIQIAASPFNYQQAEKRLISTKAFTSKFNIPVFYTNHCNSQGELIMDGGNFVVSSDGLIVDEFPYFNPEQRHYTLDAVSSSTFQQEQDKDKIKLIHDALVHGLQDYFQNIGQEKAVLGLSGGIDSAVTAVIAVRALGAENVRVLLMPSQFSTSHSIDDAIGLAENLGIHYDTIHIKDIYDSFLDKLNPIFGNLPFNVTEENIQARIRGVLNMAISNKFNNILLNTSNKSETAVGYGTLYGDLCGGIGVLGDVYKTEVYSIARYINRESEIIPHNSITKPPSAELRTGQVDSDSLPDYSILDTILYQYIERQSSIQEISQMGYDRKDVERIVRLINLNEFKRYQTAPVLRVSPKAFGIGRRIPVTGSYK